MKWQEENRLIKQALLGTYKRIKGNFLRSRNNAKDDMAKQISQSGKKSVQFKSNTNTGTNHPPTVTHSGNATHLILKLSPNFATSTNSVSTIVEETEFQLDAEAEIGQTHELSTDCKSIMGYPPSRHRF